MKSSRLCVQIEKHLATFKLSIQLEVGTEILVLFGPSGAGKTQTLNAIAGLMTPDRGEITLDGVTFFRSSERAVNIPARKRQVGYVFQHYALFPHLTALENVAYSLWRRPNSRQQAFGLLDRMHLTPFADHYPHQLSGGQQQRVAIARALAAEPKVLLMDEPFSALDWAIRESLHRELRTLQAESNLIVIYVTHNLDDALSVGHRLALVEEGRIEQIGLPEDVLRYPASPTALKVLGLRNVFEARVIAATEDELYLDWRGLRLKARPRQSAVGEIVTAHIQPDAIRINPSVDVHDAEDHQNEIIGKITSSLFGQHYQSLIVRLPNGCEIEIHLSGLARTSSSLQNGDDVRLAWPQDSLIVLPSAARPEQVEHTDQKTNEVLKPVAISKL